MSLLPLTFSSQKVNNAPPALLNRDEVIFLDLRVFFTKKDPPVELNADEFTDYFEDFKDKPIVILIPASCHLPLETIKEKLLPYEFSQFIIECLEFSDDDHFLFDLNKRIPQVRATAALVYQWMLQNQHVNTYQHFDDFTIDLPTDNDVQPLETEGPSFPKQVIDHIMEYCSDEVLLFTDCQKLLGDSQYLASIVSDYVNERDYLKDLIYQYCFKTTIINNCSHIIFLDFDGVLNEDDRADPVAVEAKKNELYPKQKNILMRERLHVRAHFFDKIAVSNLFMLLNFLPRPGIVLSSNWRLYLTLFEVQEFFSFGNYVVDMTGVDHRARGFEIATWLYNNSCTRFVVIDDTDALHASFFPHNFILVDENQLFSLENRNKALKCLLASPK